MSNRDIVARLTLNAQNFSSGTSAAFAEMQRNAADTAKRTQSAFESSFNEIQRLASKALAAQPTSTGSLDLGVEQYRQAATAAQQRALALREVASAAEVAAREEGDLSENMRVSLQAYRAAAIEAENLARERLQEANSMEILQNVMNRTKSSALALNQAQDSVTRGTRGAGMASIQASQQLQDFLIQVQGGQAVLTAFAQQGSQMAFVLAQGEGKLAKYAALLAGGWGAAVLGGITLLGMFSDKLFDTGTALEKATADLEKNQKQTALTRQAHELWEKSIGGLIEALDNLNDKTLHVNESSRQAAERAINEAETTIRLAQAKRTATIEILNQTIAYEKLETAMARVDRPAPTASAIAADAQKKILDLEEQIRQLTAGIDKGQQSLTELKIARDRMEVAAATDAVTRANQKYKDSVDALTEAFRKSKQTGADEATYKRDLAAAEKLRQAEIDAAQDAERAGRSGADGSKIEGARLLSAAQGYSGLSETGDNAALQALFRQANVNVDPKMVAWCAAFVNAVLATQGLPGTGSLSARSFLNYGSAVDKPEPGDIVILKGAAGAGSGHVGFFAGMAGTNGIRVTGGNQGNMVSTETFKSSDVLGFRRAPTDASVYAEQAKQEEAANKAAHDMIESLQQQIDKGKQLAQIGDLRRQGLDLEADIAQAILDVDSQHSDIAGKTVDEIVKQTGATREQAQAQLDLLKILEDQATARVKADHADADAKKHAADFKAMVDQAAEDGEREMEKLAELRKQQVSELADFYETAFRDGADGIWKDFKDQGRRIIAEIAAQWTLALLNGQQTSLSGVLGQLSSAGGTNFGFAGNTALGILSKIGGATSVTHLGTFGTDTGESASPWNEVIPTTSEPKIGSSGGGLLGSAGTGWAGLAITAAGLAIGSAVGSNSGAQLGSAAGAAIGSVIPGIGTVIGSVVGSILGGVLGGLFSSTKKGTATIGIDSGDLAVTQTTGNSDKRITAASDAAGQVIDALNQIADALGGDVTGTPSVSIALRNKSWRVDSSGTGQTQLSDPTVTDFGDDSEAAIKAAIIDSLNDGVIGGISEASKRILAAGKDLDKSIQKALLIESIPKLLKEHLDPLGAAIDDLNDRWKDVWDALKEGAATTEQMTQAQQLYNLELQDVKDQYKDVQTAAEDAAASLKDFLDSLNFGSSSPYSLRDQETAAKAALQPFLDKIYSGQDIDQQAYESAARSFLDIEKQLYGSTSQFFDQMNMIQAATNQAIAKLDSVQPISTPADAAAQATAANTAQTATATQATAEITAQQTDILNQILAAVRAAPGTGVSAYVADARAYA
jgi:uncharacterized protein (TIGR02594 family)